jgi:hypothetical protein
MLSRKEKRLIHRNIGRALDKCSACEHKGVNMAKDGVCYTSCPVGKELRKFSALLEKKEYQEEKVFISGKWTEDEKLYLLNHYSMYDVDHLAERLNRSHDSVSTQINRILSNKNNYIKSYA